MKKWMPMFWGEYFAKTRHLSCIEHGAYLQLIGFYWTKGKLPVEDRQLARICGLDIRIWNRIRGSIVPFFNPDWTHDRVEQELSYAIEKSKTLSANAKLRHSIGKASADTPTPTPTPIKKERKETPRADARRGPHLIPEVWKPNEKHSLLASQLGLSTEQMENYSSQMRDWSKGAGKKRTDWDATFNNWMRREAQRAYKPNGKHEPLREYKTYRPPGWTEEDDRKLREHYANRPKDPQRPTAETENLLDEGAGIFKQNQH